MDRETLELLGKIIIECISVLGAIGAAAIAAICATKNTKYANADKQKKEVTDFILGFWTKADIERLIKTGEIYTYDKPSQVKIQEYYEKLKKEEEEAISKAKEEAERPLVVNTFDGFEEVDPRIILAAKGPTGKIKLPKGLRGAVKTTTRKTTKKKKDDNGSTDW